MPPRILDHVTLQCVDYDAGVQRFTEKLPATLGPRFQVCSWINSDVFINFFRFGAKIRSHFKKQNSLVFSSECRKTHFHFRGRCPQTLLITPPKVAAFSNPNPFSVYPRFGRDNPYMEFLCRFLVLTKGQKWLNNI